MISSSKQYQQVEPLSTRHVFLDTQVYREVGHNPENPALKALKENIEAHRIVLHITDITFEEVKRQIHEQVLSQHREAKALEKHLRRWRKQAPNTAPKYKIEFDADAVAAELYRAFEMFIRHSCGAIVHQALQVDPISVFLKYFLRQPPFDGEDSKEFPDGFMLEALTRWAATQGDHLYVVTRDAAMRRAVDADLHLLILDSIQDVLSRATAEVGPEAETIADALLNHPAFDSTFTRLLTKQMMEATFIYTGDLAEGEAYEGKLLRIDQVGNWSVVSLTEQRVSVILDVTAEVQVEIQYEDRDGAIYDREDDRYYGAENASVYIEEEVEIEVFVEIDRASGEVVDGKVLTSEIDISEPSDYDYR
jgi:hypothetical protein